MGLTLCYPSDIRRAAQYLDTVMWGVLEKAVGQHIPRGEEGLGWECVIQTPVRGCEGRSFQSWLARLPVRLGGLGLRSPAETSPIAFIGGVEMAIPAFVGD